LKIKFINPTLIILIETNAKPQTRQTVNHKGEPEASLEDVDGIPNCPRHVLFFAPILINRIVELSHDILDLEESEKLEKHEFLEQETPKHTRER
jgi:hypothetical protein